LGNLFRRADATLQLRRKLRASYFRTAAILSININRRHMTATQRAMAMAMIFPQQRGYGPDARILFNSAATCSSRSLMKRC
jgi:hypothetical protein